MTTCQNNDWEYPWASFQYVQRRVVAGGSSDCGPSEVSVLPTCSSHLWGQEMGYELNRWWIQSFQELDDWDAGDLFIPGGTVTCD